jgi:hypothetical protein
MYERFYLNDDEVDQDRLDYRIIVFLIIQFSVDRSFFQLVIIRIYG